MHSFLDFYSIRLVLANILRMIVGLAKIHENWIHPKPKTRPPDEVASCESEGRSVQMHIYLPSGHDPNYPELAVHVNWHASGFLLNGMGEDAPFCDYICQKVGCVVIDADYAKSPEHPWPAAVHDVDAVLKWVKANSARRGWDINRLSVGGFSAGGNMALIASTVGPERHLIKAAVAFYPAVDQVTPVDKKADLRPDIDEQERKAATISLKFFDVCYLWDTQADRKSPWVSPTFANTASFPPSVTLITAGKDLLMNETEVLVQKLILQPGVDVKHYNAEGEEHMWDKKAIDGDHKRHKDESYELVAQRLKAALFQDGPRSSN